jgi:hypothetical protein
MKPSAIRGGPPVTSPKMTSRILLVALCLLLAGCGRSNRYEVVGTRGNYTHLVYVPPQYADDQSVYEQAIRDICSDPDTTYILMFWNDRGKIWYREHGEMTAEQSSAQVAGYNRDPQTGLNDFYWLRDGERIDVGPIE